MTDTQRRYTNEELLAMLRILASDYNRKPTQREILVDERMPTHHTINKRFESVDGALAAAGLADLQESNLHASTRAVFEQYNIDIRSEWALTGAIMVDFTVIDDKGLLHWVDVIDMPQVVCVEEIADMREHLATPYVVNYHQVRTIGDAVRMADYLSGGKVIADIVGE